MELHKKSAQQRQRQQNLARVEFSFKLCDRQSYDQLNFIACLQLGKSAPRRVKRGRREVKKRGDFVGNEKLLPKWELYLANLYEAANTANLLCRVPEMKKKLLSFCNCGHGNFSESLFLFSQGESLLM